MSFGGDNLLTKLDTRVRDLPGGGTFADLSDPIGLFKARKEREFPTPPTVSPPPTEQSPEIELARKNQRAQMLRARGRASAQLTTPGLLTKRPSLNRPALSDTLG